MNYDYYKLNKPRKYQMFEILSMLVTVVNDVKDEILNRDSRKYSFVTSDSELKSMLKKFDVKLSDVKDVKTGKPIKNWNKISGVFNDGETVYAYSEDIKSELISGMKT